jgi:hypothetical protein
MRLVAKIYPMLKEDQRTEIFHYALKTTLDLTAVDDHFRVLRVTLTSSVGVLNALFGDLKLTWVLQIVPPPGADIKTFDVDVLRVFYHSTHSADPLNPGPFFWNFYIGRQGEGVDSIILDAHKKYEVKLSDNWVPCYPMVVLPGTRVRIITRGSEV